MRKFTKSLTPFLEKYLIFVLIGLFTCLYSIIAITKYIHFQTGLDLAIYVQTFWYYSHFHLPFVTLYPTYGDLVWADHFTPSLMLLTPLFWIWRDPRMILIFQSLAFTTAAYPIFRFAKKQLKHTFFAYALAFMFLTFFGVQYPVTFDFHEANMAAALLPWVLWSMFEGKWIIFVVLASIMSGFKEDAPLYVSGLATYLIVTRKNWKLGLPLLVLSFSYFLLVTEILMPSFAHNAAKVFSTSYFSFTFQYLWSVFFNSPIKIHTMLLSFYNFLFLPLLAGPFLILPFVHFFINFSNPDFPGRWGIYLHYRGYLAAIFGFGTVLGYLNLLKWKPTWFKRNKVKTCFAILVILNAFFMDVTLHLPLNIFAKKQFYYQEPWIKDNERVIQHIPANAYVVTMNSLAPQIALRENIFYYPQNVNKADYIFVDLHPNQPPVSFWLTSDTSDNEGQLREEIMQLVKENTYSIYYQSGDAFLLKNNQPH